MRRRRLSSRAKAILPIPGEETPAARWHDAGMDIRPIRTDEEHRAALREIEALWGAEQGKAEGDRLDILATLVDAYEEARRPSGSWRWAAAIRTRPCRRGGGSGEESVDAHHPHPR